MLYNIVLYCVQYSKGLSPLSTFPFTQIFDPSRLSGATARVALAGPGPRADSDRSGRTRLGRCSKVTVSGGRCQTVSAPHGGLPGWARGPLAPAFESNSRPDVGLGNTEIKNDGPV